MKRFRLSSILGCMLLIAASAQATQMTFTFDYGSMPQGTLYLYNGDGQYKSYSVAAGVITARVDGSGQSFEVYCADLMHDVYSGEKSDVAFKSMQQWTQQNLLTSTPGSFPWLNNTEPRAGEAAAFLYDTYSNQVHGNTVEEAALQLAIWEVLYEGSASGPLVYDVNALDSNNQPNPNKGNIYFTGFDSQVTQFAQTYLNAIPIPEILSNYNALWLASPQGAIGPTQEFIGPSQVSEPLPLLLVGSGMVLVGGDVLRRRRKLSKPNTPSTV